MKVFITSILIALSLSMGIAAQDAKVIAELAAKAENVVKNSPFSAEAVSESVQTLADGNRIVRNSTTKLYRNSEGRFRRELKSGSGGMLGGAYSFGSGVTILDPVAGHRYLLDPEQRTARTALLRAARPVRAKGEAAPPEPPSPPAAPDAPVDVEVPLPALPGVPGVYRTVAPTIAGGLEVFTSAASSKYDSRTEELGSRNIEGVEAEGTRTTTTIPADAIGNERPIEIVYERWHSKELGLIVMSKHSDPRFGEQTYRLTNIVRTEPDPSLFTLPTGYKVLGDAPNIYTLTTRYKQLVEKAAAAAAKAPVIVIAPGTGVPPAKAKP
jgi:hypothetical protein